VAGIRKKLLSPNAHTAHFALIVTESVVKNCGPLVHDEIASKAFMDTLKDLLKTSKSDQVRDKTLELIQTWAHLFKSNSKYKVVEVRNW